MGLWQSLALFQETRAETLVKSTFLILSVSRERVRVEKG